MSVYGKFDMREHNTALVLNLKKVVPVLHKQYTSEQEQRVKWNCENSENLLLVTIQTLNSCYFFSLWKTLFNRKIHQKICKKFTEIQIVPITK